MWSSTVDVQKVPSRQTSGDRSLAPGEDVTDWKILREFLEVWTKFWQKFEKVGLGAFWNLEEIVVPVGNWQLHRVPRRQLTRKHLLWQTETPSEQHSRPWGTFRPWGILESILGALSVLGAFWNRWPWGVLKSQKFEGTTEYKMKKECGNNLFGESLPTKKRSRPNIQSGPKLQHQYKISETLVGRFAIIQSWYLTGASMTVASSISHKLVWESEKRWNREITVEKLCYET